MTSRMIRVTAASAVLLAAAGLVVTGTDDASGAVGGSAVAAQAPATPPTEPGMGMSSSGTMMPGDSGTVNGWGFQPGSTVTLWMNGAEMATAVADTLGNVAFTVTIPMDMAPGAATMAMTGISLAGSAVNLSTGVAIGALAGQLAPATPAVADPHMTG